MFKLLFKFIVLLATFSTLFWSCSTPEIEGKTEAEKLYKEAQGLIKNGRFLLATEKLNIIRSKYPYSYYATFAELMSADVLFQQESYAEAAAAYIVFKDYHPRHEKIPYVLSRIGESFYKQIPATFDRDLAPAFESIKYYNFLIRSFPQSEFIGDARERIAYSEKMIRDKEKYIADFYYKTEVYKAARYRYDGIINKFQNKELVDHALIRSLQSSIKLSDPDFCKDNYARYSGRVSDESRKRLKSFFNRCVKLVKKGDSVEKL